MKKADCEASLRACRLKTSNEVKKLKVIVAQLDSLTTRLPNDEKEAVLPEIETLRQSIGKGIEQFNDSFDEANLSLDLDKGDCDSSHNTQETIHDPDNDVNEQHMERTAEIASQKQVLQSWQQLEDVIRDLNDVFSQLSHSVWVRKTIDPVSSCVTLSNSALVPDTEADHRSDRNKRHRSTRAFLQRSCHFVSGTSSIHVLEWDDITLSAKISPTDKKGIHSTAGRSSDRNSNRWSDRDGPRVQSCSSGLSGDSSSRLLGRKESPAVVIPSDDHEARTFWRRHSY